MDNSNIFKKSLKQDRRQIGFWLTLASVTATEISAHAGFDWLLIDMEHSVNELPDVLDHLRAATGGTAEPIVRVPWNEPVVVKRLLDAGARTLLFPFVENVMEAKAAVEATRYPPKGKRGVSSVTRATRYGRASGYAASYETDLCVVVQVETPAAVALAGEIASVDGVDGVFIGVGDLSANMGMIGRGWNAEPVRDLAMAGLRSIRQAGKGAGTLNYDGGQAKELFDAGFNFIAVGSDTGMLARGTDRLVAAFRE